jgi:hypothetical protein
MFASCCRRSRENSKDSAVGWDGVDDGRVSQNYLALPCPALPCPTLPLLPTSAQKASPIGLKAPAGASERGNDRTNSGDSREDGHAPRWKSETGLARTEGDGGAGTVLGSLFFVLYPSVT